MAWRNASADWTWELSDEWAVKRWEAKDRTVPPDRAQGEIGPGRSGHTDPHYRAAVPLHGHDLLPQQAINGGSRCCAGRPSRR